MSFVDPVVAERFWSKVALGGPNECWRWTASMRGKGYGSFRFNRRMQGAHRVAYELVHGSIPPGMEIDHLCFNKGCVNPAHLRAVTDKQNNENHRGRACRNSKSGVRGVHMKKGRWCAQVSHNGRCVHVGCFDSLEDAERAVIAARLNLHSHNDVDRLWSPGAGE